MKILDRYIYKEFLPPFLASTFLFTVLFLLQHLKKLSELMFEKNVPFVTVMELLLYSIPFTAAITIPMGTLFGSLFSLGRLAQDNEIVIFRSSGISLYRMLRPVFVMGVVVTLFLFYFMNFVMTQTNLRYKSIYINILYSNPGVVMTPKEFSSFADGFQKIAAFEIGKDGELRNIYVYDMDPDTRAVNLIYANRGHWFNNEFNTSELSLNLFDGEMLRFKGNGDDTIDRVKFEKIVVNVVNDVRSIEIASEGLREMSFLQARELIQTQLKDQQKVHPFIYVEYHRKFSIPLACIAFVMISIPLAVNVRFRSKGAGLGLSLVVVLIYYSLMTTSEALGKKEIVDPQLALHIPNIIFWVASLILLVVYSRR